MNVPVEINIEEYELSQFFNLAEYADYANDTVRVDKQTADWIKQTMVSFFEVQEYLRSIHPDYVER